MNTLNEWRMNSDLSMYMVREGTKSEWLCDEKYKLREIKLLINYYYENYYYIIQMKRKNTL